MKLGFFLVGLFAVTMAPHGARAACDVCEMSTGEFSPGNVIPGEEGQPDGTCQDVAADLEALDQNSIECGLYTMALSLLCCVDASLIGLPQVAENGGCDLCPDDSLNFAGGNVIRQEDKPDVTCQEFATALNVTNIDQTSFECVAGVVVALTYCCSAATVLHTLATLFLAGALAIAAMM